MRKKRSFFEKLTGSIRIDNEEEDILLEETEEESKGIKNNDWMEEENDEAELTIDMYHNHSDIIIKAMVAGVKPEDLDISIRRDMVSIKGKRKEDRVNEEDYFTKELYWGKFSRTIMLPQEVEPEEAEATEKHGLLTVKLPKIDKEKKAHLKVKSI